MPVYVILRDILQDMSSFTGHVSKTRKRWPKMFFLLDSNRFNFESIFLTLEF